VSLYGKPHVSLSHVNDQYGVCLGALSWRERLLDVRRLSRCLASRSAPG
jgi:hypothetical protein